MRVLRVLGAATLLFPAKLVSAQSTFQGLGFFTSSLPNQSSANGISRNGTYVVGSSNGRGFLWTVSGGLQPIPALEGNNQTDPNAVSDNAVVVGSTLLNNSLAAFRWTAASGTQDLGSLGPGNSQALGVSVDGSVVVGQSSNRPFRWSKNTGMVALAANGTAWAVSADGSVVFGTSDGHPFSWTSTGGLLALPDFGFTGVNNILFACNSSGSIAVGSGQGYSGAEMLRWTPATDAHSLIGFDQAAIANGLSDDGNVIVGDAASVGKLWFHSSGAQDAKAYLSAQGASAVNSWNSIQSVTGISGDGTKICGYGVDPNNHFQAFYATITPPDFVGFAELSDASIAPTPRVGGVGIDLKATTLNPAGSGGSRFNVVGPLGPISFRTSELFAGGSGVYIKQGAKSGVTYGSTQPVSNPISFATLISDGRLGKYAWLTVVPAELYIPTLSTTSVKGGQSVTLFLQLNGQSSGLAATLKSNNAAVHVPGSVMFVSGDSSKSVTMTTTAVTQTTQVTITATYRGRKKTVVLTVNP